MPHPTCSGDGTVTTEITAAVHTNTDLTLCRVQVWYGVPAHASEALEEAMKDALPHLFEAAPSLMYQLVTMLSPTQLKARGVPVCRLVHQEGSFVITFPNAYHAGFNTGEHLAAGDRWHIQDLQLSMPRLASANADLMQPVAGCVKLSAAAAQQHAGVQQLRPSNLRRCPALPVSHHAYSLMIFLHGLPLQNACAM